ncbi:MAG TPA: hypothetical protein VFB45_03290 [Pseudolabrys sp.]|nr:hypothetical protein [Pseudolabrys sp.]
MRDDSKKAENQRSNVMPIDGYVLSVDGKLKMRYERASEAMTAAVQLKQRYPVIKVAVYDAAQRVYKAVETEADDVSPAVSSGPAGPRISGSAAT